MIPLASSAAKVLDKLKQSGYDVPQDISLIGFGDYDSAYYLTPSLTTMHYDRRSVGEEAGRGILDLIKGKPFKSIMHRPQLKIRRSVTAPNREK